MSTASCGVSVLLGFVPGVRSGKPLPKQNPRPKERMESEQSVDHFGSPFWKRDSDLFGHSQSRQIINKQFNDGDIKLLAVVNGPLESELDSCR